jgi:hypothetical protein
MSAIPTVPVTIMPEAATRVAELGMLAELEQMLERARQIIPLLGRLEVILEPAWDTGDEPYLTIQAWVQRSPRWNDRARDEWARWKGSRFPPEVCRHITLLVEPLSSTAGNRTLSGEVTVPVATTPAAMERVDELGMFEEFEQMLVQSCRLAPGLKRIKVEINDRMDGSAPGVSIALVGNEGFRGDFDHKHPLRRWYLNTFPPEVVEHFLITTGCEDNHAR